MSMYGVYRGLGRSLWSLVRRTRRNHALEHATLHLLSAEVRGVRLMGHTSPWGFTICGAVPREAVEAAAREGLARLQAGDWRLALHPNCGSNLVVAGVLAAVATFATLGGRGGWRRRLVRLPLACVAAALGVALGQPLGALLQARVTTQARVGDLRIAEIQSGHWLGIPAVHIRTEG